MASLNEPAIVASAGSVRAGLLAAAGIAIRSSRPRSIATLVQRDGRDTETWLGNISSRLVELVGFPAFDRRDTHFGKASLIFSLTWISSLND